MLTHGGQESRYRLQSVTAREIPSAVEHHVILLEAREQPLNEGCGEIFLTAASKLKNKL